MNRLGAIIQNYAIRKGKPPCVLWSFALALDLRGDLVVAILPAAKEEERAENPEFSPVPFIHAWVEKGSWVHSPTIAYRHGETRPIPRKVYYHVNAPTQVKVLPHRSAQELDRKLGFTSALKHRKSRAVHRDTTKVILDVMKVKFKADDETSLLPEE